MAEDINTLVMKVTSDGIKQGTTDLNKLTKAADAAEKAVKKLGTSVIQSNSQFTSGTATAAAMLHAMEKLAATMNILAQTQIRAASSTRVHNESMREAHALARGLSGSMGALWLTYGNFAGMAAGLAIGASLKGIVAVGSDVEHTLETIRVLGESTTAEISKMREAISELGNGVNGPKDVAEAMQVLTLAGLSATDALKGVGASLNLAIAGDVSIEKSATTLVQVGTALGYTADGFDHVADVIAKTAAVSMSSVDSIAGAFKSAAAVGEVYGASLQDIGVGLAAVANLGIQGTAAGTALKNFYKDLASQSEKVVSTYKAMGVSMDMIKDKNGNFLPLVEVIKNLDKGLSQLEPKLRGIAIDKMLGERGVKTASALFKMLHTESTEMDAENHRYANKLEEVNDRINRSYAFSTLAAIAMTQTTKNQMKSVGSTLQNSFSKAFTEIEPQINGVSRALKAAFNSPEFINGIKAIAVAVADTTRFLVEHIKYIGLAAAAYTGWRVVTFAAGLLEVGAAFKVATTGAAMFGVALGPIAVAIMAMGAAWAIYNANKDKSITNRDAQAGMTEFADGVIAAAEKTKKANQLRREGKTEADILRQQEDDDAKAASAKAIQNSEKGLSAMKAQHEKEYAEMNGSQRAMVDLAKQKKLQVTGLGYVDAYLENDKRLAAATIAHANTVKVIKGATSILIAENKEAAMAADAAAAAAKIHQGGDKNLNGDPNKGAISAAYAASIKEQDNIIKAANREFLNSEEKYNSDFRAGRMGRVELINKVADAEVKATKTITSAINEKIRIAQAGKNKDGDEERFEGDSVANKERAAQADVMRAKFTTEEIAKVEQDAAKYRAKTLEDQGKWAEAAQVKFVAEHGIMFAQATTDALEYGEVYPQLWKKVEEYTERAKAAVLAGQVKEAFNEFELAALKTGNAIKGVQTATEAGGMAGMWEAATEASQIYKASLADLEAKQKKLATLAVGGSDADKTKAEEAANKIEALAEKHKTMWVGIGTSIGESLEQGFGRGGKAMGDLIKSYISFDKLSDKSSTAKVRFYGQAADAAKGFFHEGTKGYKTLEGVSKVFHLAEMANTLGLINLKAIMAVMTQGGGDPYTAFARMASMAAIVGALGFAVGGGFSGGQGGRTAEEVQKTQGTGVFGDADAKSESIMKSIEDMENNTSMLLPLTQGMLASLKNIEASMVGLTNLVVRTDGVTEGSNFGVQEGVVKNSGNLLVKGAMTVLGGVVGLALSKLWGKTTTSIVDSGIQYGGKVSDLQGGKGYNQYASVDTTKSSWFGLKKTTSNSLQTQGLSEELSSQFGLIFTGLEDTLKIAAPILGKNADEVGKALDDLVIQTTTLSLKGLKGKDLQDAINSVISKTMDEIAEAAFPSMGAFRQVGEGYAQTVMRVATGIEQAQLALKSFGITAINYTEIANKTADVATSIIQQSIALKEGATGVGSIMKAMVGTADDLVKVYGELVKARKSMMDVGLGNGLNIDTIDGAGGLDKLSAGLETYYSKFFTVSEQVAIETKNLTEQFAAVGSALPTSREELRSFVEVAAAAGDQKKVGGLIALADAFDNLNTKIGKGGLKSVVDLADDAYKALSKAVAKEKKEVDRVYKLQSEANKKTHEEAMIYLQAELNAKEAYVAAQKDLVDASISGIEKIINALASAVKATEPLLSQADAYRAALQTAKSAVSSSRGGTDIGTIAGLEDAIGTLGKPVEDMYGTQLEFNIAQAEANAVLKALNVEGNKQLSEAQQMLISLDEMVKTAKGAIDAENERYRLEQEKLDKQHEDDIAKLDETLRIAGEQLDALNGINLGVMSVADALSAFTGSVANAALSRAAAVDAGPKSVSASSDAIEMLYGSLLGRASDKAGKEYWNGQAFAGVSMKAIAQSFIDSDEYKSRLPGLATGTNFVPEDMDVRVHQGERVIPAADNAELMRRMKAGEDIAAGTANSSLEGKIDELIEIVKIGDTANVMKAQEMYRIFRDWNANGMPEVRVTEE